MGIVAALAPWIVYWVLVGNVPVVVAGLTGLALAVASSIVRQHAPRPGKALGTWAVATFSVLTVLPLIASEAFVARWVQPLSLLAILLAALTCSLIGKPLVREFTAASQPAQVTNSESFASTTSMIDSMWLIALAGMCVSSVVPPITQSNATAVDADLPASYLCSWVVPFLLLGTAMLISRILIDRMVAEALSPHVVRRSTFVAFKELGIDELMYLAKEKADREAGAGMEAFAVQVGGRGIPLTGDESRESWPVTFKARERA